MSSYHHLDVIGQTLGGLDHRMRAISAAAQLYQTVRNWSRMHRIRSVLTRKSYHLFNLETIQAACTVRGCRYAGVRTVPIRQIRGSEGRCEDFDVNFSPLQTHTRERWLHIAVARQAGEEMPPVKLIRIGEVYFVRDGHYRISVARALGQKEIEAEVTVWQIVGPSSRAHSCAWTSQSADQVAGARRKTSRVRLV